MDDRDHCALRKDVEHWPFTKSEIYVQNPMSANLLYRCQLDGKKRAKKVQQETF